MPKKVRKTPREHTASLPAADHIAGQVYVLKTLTLENGSCPFEDWFKGIRDTTTRQRIQSRLDRIERGNLGDHASVGEGVYEARFMFGVGYRIYFAMIGTSIVVLLMGGDKSSKSSQDRDIALAQSYWKDYKDDAERHQRDFRR